MKMIEIPMYSLSAGIVYVQTIRVKKHKYKKDFISAKLFEYSEERWGNTSTHFNNGNKTNARKLPPMNCCSSRHMFLISKTVMESRRTVSSTSYDYWMFILLLVYMLLVLGQMLNFESTNSDIVIRKAYLCSLKIATILISFH